MNHKEKKAQKVNSRGKRSILRVANSSIKEVKGHNENKMVHSIVIVTSVANKAIKPWIAPRSKVVRILELAIGVAKKAIGLWIVPKITTIGTLDPFFDVVS